MHDKMKDQQTHNTVKIYGTNIHVKTDKKFKKKANLQIYPNIFKQLFETGHGVETNCSRPRQRVPHIDY